MQCRLLKDFRIFGHLYRVSHLPIHLGLVDLDIECFMLPCQKWLGSWVRWWNIEIKVNPTHVYKQRTPFSID